MIIIKSTQELRNSILKMVLARCFNEREYKNITMIS